VSWKPCWRIIPSRFPPVDLFQPIAPEADWLILQELEGRTNERLRDEAGELNLVRPEDRLGGKNGDSLIMAPFTHPHPEGDWLSDGTFGVCHVEETFDQALAVAVNRREIFLRQTAEGPMTLQMRVLNLDLHGMLHDFRGTRFNSDRKAVEVLGRQLRDQGSFGIICDPISPSIPRVSIFRPPALANCRQERHLAFQWDGVRISRIYDYATGSDVRRPAGI